MIKLDDICQSASVELFFLLVIALIVGFYLLISNLLRKLYKSAISSSLDKLAEKFDGEICENKADTDWLKGIINEILMGLHCSNISFRSLLKSKEETGILYLGNYEYTISPVGEEVSLTHSVFCCQDDWNLEGRTNIRARTISSESDIFSYLSVSPIALADSMPGFKAKFIVTSNNKESMEKILTPDLQELLLEQKDYFPFKDPYRANLLISIGGDSLVMLCPGITDTGLLESLYERGRKISGMVRQIVSLEK